MATTPTLLLIDDDSLRRVTEFTLQEAGYAVLTASNGREGLNLFRSTPVDLVVTDVTRSTLLYRMQKHGLDRGKSAIELPED